MGIDYSVHVGAYLECKTHSKDVSRSIKCCPNKTCKEFKEEFHNSKKFCAECGTKISLLEVTEKGQEISQAEVLSTLEDRLWPLWLDDDLVHIYLSNRGEGKETFYPHSIGTKVREISSESRYQDILDLKEKHIRDIEYLENQYGEANVEVKWGIIFRAG